LRSTHTRICKRRTRTHAVAPTPSTSNSNSNRSGRRGAMEIVYTRCCGLEVQKRSVVAGLWVPGPQGTPTKDIRTFGTRTHDLLARGGGLRAAGCTHVAMESTGVFWQPIYNLLAGPFELLGVNAQHLKAVPGRKTEVRDAEWIAELLRRGLLRPSFIPARP